MVWYFHLLKNVPLFVVIHTVKGFCVVNKAEVDVFLELSCFLDDPTDIGSLISGFQGCVLYHEATFKYTHIFLLVCVLNVNMINFCLPM